MHGRPKVRSENQIQLKSRAKSRRSCLLQAIRPAGVCKALRCIGCRSDKNPGSQFLHQCEHQIRWYPWSEVSLLPERAVPFLNAEGSSSEGLSLALAVVATVKANVGPAILYSGRGYGGCKQREVRKAAAFVFF